MAKSKSPRRPYRPRGTLVCPMSFGMSAKCSNDLSLKDRLAINGVVNGKPGSEDASDNLAGVEMILVAQIYVLREAIARPALHQTPVTELEAMLELLEWTIAPKVDAIRQRLKATGLVTCKPDEAEALSDLGELGDAMRAVIPRRLITEGYAQALYSPEIRLDQAFTSTTPAGVIDTGPRSTDWMPPLASASPPMLAMMRPPGVSQTPPQRTRNCMPIMSGDGAAEFAVAPPASDCRATTAPSVVAADCAPPDSPAGASIVPVA
jgi:hypothetical protein